MVRFLFQRLVASRALQGYIFLSEKVNEKKKKSKVTISVDGTKLVRELKLGIGMSDEIQQGVIVIWGKVRFYV